MCLIRSHPSPLGVDWCGGCSTTKVMVEMDIMVGMGTIVMSTDTMVEEVVEAVEVG